MMLCRAASRAARAAATAAARPHTRRGIAAAATVAAATATYPPPDASRAGTCDLTDKYFKAPVDERAGQPNIAIIPPNFGGTGLRDFGGVTRFSGRASTVQCFENNPHVRAALSEPGKGRVLVVDGGGSMRCALLGDMLAACGAENGWAGIVINGCVRDAEDLAKTPIGIKALATHPLKSSKRDAGARDVPVTFGSATITPGDFIYADLDGILVSPEPLTLP